MAFQCINNTISVCSELASYCKDLCRTDQCYCQCYCGCIGDSKYITQYCQDLKFEIIIMLTPLLLIFIILTFYKTKSKSIIKNNIIEEV